MRENVLDDLLKSLNVPEPSAVEKQQIENIVSIRQKIAYAVIRHLPPLLDEKRGTIAIRKMHQDIRELLLLGFVGPAMAYCGPFLEHYLEDAIIHHERKRLKRDLTIREERRIEQGDLQEAIKQAEALNLLTPDESVELLGFADNFRHHYQHGSLAAITRGQRLVGVQMVNQATGVVKPGDRLTEEENRPLRGILKMAQDSQLALPLFRRLDEVLRAIWDRQDRRRGIPVEFR